MENDTVFILHHPPEIKRKAKRVLVKYFQIAKRGSSYIWVNSVLRSCN
jgi:hypothetical protein